MIGPTSVWVLGQNERHNPATAVAARWNGRQWATMPLAALPSFEYYANVAPDWAAAENPTTYAPELLHLYGDHWSLVPGPHVRPPKGAQGYHFNDILDHQGSQLVTVGYDGNESIAPGLTLYRRSGASWHRVANLPKQAPGGLTTDSGRGTWLLSSGVTVTTSLLHVGPGGRVLRRVGPPRTADGRMQIEGIAHVPGTASLTAAGEFVRHGDTSAAVGRYRR